MFPTSSSQQKRKYSEFHDPDYPNEYQTEPAASTSAASSSKRARSSENVAQPTTTTESPSNHHHDAEESTKRVCDIVSREFDNEIGMKQQQLDVIDQRLLQANVLLNRLRHKLVSDYYREQEPPQAEAKSAALTVRGEETLFENEYLGPQMALHPAIKKIVGKQPRSYKELLRQVPGRAAAQNARSTLRVLSQTERRLERRRLQMIRQRGIVIDHSKNEGETTDDAVSSNSNRSAAPLAVETTSEAQLPGVSSVKPLNTSRLNNKTRQLIVIGNTSKYIGNEESESGWQAPKSGGQTLSHKWLVYVHSKDSAQPIENFVSKVRFYLHASYRPNDVVDICAPPFHLMRRGWGEFPIRIQLHFHSYLRQKPVQLIHQIVLDKTLSGRQTRGAETMVEVWLRSAVDMRRVTHAASLDDPSPAKDGSSSLDATTTAPLRQPRTISFTQSKEELDDNLFDFLNNIAATPDPSLCADIDKIQPTVMVSEPLEVLASGPLKALTLKSISPTTDSVKHNSLTSTANNANKEHASMCVVRSIANIAPKATTPAAATPLIPTPAPVAPEPTIVPALPSTVIVTPTTMTPAPTSTFSAGTLPPRQGVAQILKIDPKSFKSAPPASLALKAAQPPRYMCNINQSGLKIILDQSGPNSATSHVKRLSFAVGPPTIPASAATTARKPLLQPPLTNGMALPVLQKKWVQLVDAQGKVTRVQMLVAAAAAPSEMTATTTTAATTTATTTTATTTTTTATTTSATTTTTTATTTSAATQGHASSSPMNTKQVATTGALALGPSVLRKEPKAVDSQVPERPDRLAAASTPPTKSTTTALGIRNGQQATTPKNVVFQREGKLYIIDPLQMKMRQQQPKQISLLKPQVSLLRQQQQKPPPQQQQQQQSMSDHDYAPLSQTPVAPIVKQPQPPPLHLGVRQTRENVSNANEQRAQRRRQFEENFRHVVDFPSMRAATEYLLRRLPLVVEGEDADVSAAAVDFPFVYRTRKKFEALSAIKQRACEWLRAKFIATCLRSHSTLQALNAAAAGETFWSTREIVMFARCHAYTPSLKKLQLSPLSTTRGPSSATPFTAVVKSELQQEQRLLHCDTLTENLQINGWVERELARVHHLVTTNDADDIIDVDGVDETKASKRNVAQATKEEHAPTAATAAFLPIPPKLDNAGELVSDICRERHVHLQPEELCAGVVQPAALTVLAHCLNKFVERLVRRAVAAKAQSQQPLDSWHCVDDGERLSIGLQEIGKVIAQDDEYDFLTNRYFGVLCPAEEESKDVKGDNRDISTKDK